MRSYCRSDALHRESPATAGCPSQTVSAQLLRLRTCALLQVMRCARRATAAGAQDETKARRRGRGRGKRVRAHTKTQVLAPRTQAHKCNSFNSSSDRLIQLFVRFYLVVCKRVCCCCSGRSATATQLRLTSTHKIALLYSQLSF